MISLTNVARGVSNAPTIHPSVVRFDINLLHLTVLRDQRVALAALVTEDGGAIEGQIECLGELARGVAQEANLDQPEHQYLYSAYVQADGD